MNADGSRPVAVRLSVAATMPDLSWIAAGLLAAGILVLAAGVRTTGRRAHPPGRVGAQRLRGRGLELLTK